MKPTAPLRNKFRVFATTPCRGLSDVGLNNVVDSQNNTGNVSAPMGVLLGDVDASGRIDSTDVYAVRQQTMTALP
jgi:hypothetical protein